MQEFLQAMQRPSQLRGHAGADPEVMAAVNAVIEDTRVEVPEEESDSEYENVPKKPKTVNAEKSVPQPPVSEDSRPDAMDVDQLVAAGAEQAEQKKPDGDVATDTTAQPPNPVSDDDWLRSRTSRLLGMVEDDDEDGQPAPAPTTSVQPPRQIEPDAEFEGFEDEPVAQGQSVSIPVEDEHLEDAPPVDEVEEKVRQSQRLYLRNLSYNITEDDLREAFDGFGNLDEVSRLSFLTSNFISFVFKMNIQIGTSDAQCANGVIRIGYFSRCFSSLIKKRNALSYIQLSAS